MVAQAISIRSIKSKLLAMMVLRVLLALAFLGVTLWVQLSQGLLSEPLFYPLYAIAAFVGLITLFYALILNSIRRLRLLAYIQLTVDVIIISVIVYVTGGIVSYLNILYLLLVIGGSIVLDRRGGYYTAAISSIIYGVLIDLEFYRLLPAKHQIFFSPVDSTWEDVVTTIASNVLAFFTVAFLTGYITNKAARMERALHEKDIDFDRLEHLNRQIVDNIPTGIMTIDEGDRITSFNRAATDITGYSLRDVYYRNMDETFPALSEVVSNIGESELRVERDYETKDGEDICLGFAVSPGQGEDMANVVIFQDLTQIKTMEAELRRDDRLKALGELSAAIAHEIRNPLASISGSVHVLKEELSTSLTGDRRHLMDIVVREADRLNALITDFLLFAKPAEGETESFDVIGIMDETMKVFSNSPEAAGIEIDTTCGVSDGVDDGRSACIDGNRRQISQVFWNLLLNATISMKDSQSGKADPSSILSVATTLRSEGEDLIEISVADSGRGIAPENIERIFDPFFSTRELGTGLGLSLVHRIVESHGGKIEVESELGKGTTFKVSLPLTVKACERDALKDG